MKKRPLDMFILLLVVAVIAGGALGVVDAVAPASETGPGGLIPPLPFFGEPLGDRLNLLLVGADDRVVASGEHQQGRSDTLILVALAPQQHRAAMLSLPRDLLITLPEAEKIVGYDYPHKINAAYSFGGVDLTRRTVERVLEMNLDNYAKVDLKAFVEAVDALGGVEIDVPDVEERGRGMNYEDYWGGLKIHLKPGRQVLDGEQAMGFVRYRKSMYTNSRGVPYGINDFERGKNQQTFIKAVVEQKVKLQNLPDLLKVGGIIMKRLDTDIDWRQATSLMRVLRSMESDDILQLTLPAKDQRINGGDYVTVDPEDIARVRRQIDQFLSGALIVQAEADEETAPVVEAPPRVAILNGCGVAGLAGRAASALEGSGYQLDPPTNAASKDWERSRIEYRKGDKDTAQAIARELGLRRPDLKQVAQRPEGPAITVILGRDYADQAAP